MLSTHHGYLNVPVRIDEMGNFAQKFMFTEYLDTKNGMEKKILTKLKDNRFLIYFNLAEPTQIEPMKSIFSGSNCFPYYLALDNEIKPID